MADNFHFSVNIISRGKGKSAVASAAYISGEKIKNEWDGVTHDYTKKQGVISKEIFLPDHAPKEYKDRKTLWNSVELFEKNSNAQLARNFIISLPKELSIEENKKMIEEYVQNNFVKEGMIVDLAIHDESREGNQNIHAHIITIVRQIMKMEHTKVKKAAPKTSKENNPHYFKSVAEAIAAYPDSKPMYENGKYIVFSDKAPLIGYEFNSVQEAADVFPNLTVEAKNGKYYVYTSQAPLLKYTFDTQAEAFEAFENIKPMYENGKYVIYTQEAPKVKYEFATAEEALKAFPGSTVEAKDGKYYVYTTMDPVEGTVAKKVVGNPTPLKRISSHSGEVISDNTAKENKKSSANEGSAKAKAPAKANKNVKTGVAGLTGVVATLAAASAALFKSKRR